jgi:hypothetical protein
MRDGVIIFLYYNIICYYYINNIYIIYIYACIYVHV